MDAPNQPPQPPGSFISPQTSISLREKPSVSYETLCLSTWHFINFTVISFIFINENMKFSKETLSKAFQECPMSDSLGKHWTLIDYFSRKLIFFEILWDLEPRWHFINFTVISLIVINESMKFSKEILSKVFQECPMSDSLGKHWTFIDNFSRKLIFFQIHTFHFHFQFQFILFWTNQFQIWKHQWIPQWMRFTLIMFYKECSVLATPWQISYFLGRSLAVP